MWKRKRKSKKEWLPWYRARKYKGDLTEAEKRQLDAFRTQPQHPAASADQLPREVQKYIDRIELELYELKEREVGLAHLFVLLGAASLVLRYFGYLDSTWGYMGGGLMLGGLWYIFRRKPEEFGSLDPDSPGTDEAIRKEWELTYVYATRERHEEESK